MTLTEISQWATLLNLLLVPIAVAIINMRESLSTLKSEAQAHRELDDERFSTVSTDVDRAHKRLNSVTEMVNEHETKIAVLQVADK